MPAQRHIKRSISLGGISGSSREQRVGWSPYPQTQRMRNRRNTSCSNSVPENTMDSENVHPRKISHVFLSQGRQRSRSSQDKNSTIEESDENNSLDVNDVSEKLKDSLSIQTNYRNMEGKKQPSKEDHTDVSGTENKSYNGNVCLDQGNNEHVTYTSSQPYALHRTFSSGREPLTQQKQNSLNNESTGGYFKNVNSTSFSEIFSGHQEADVHTMQQNSQVESPKSCGEFKELKKQSCLKGRNIDTNGDRADSDVNNTTPISAPSFEDILFLGNEQSSSSMPLLLMFASGSREHSRLSHLFHYNREAEEGGDFSDMQSLRRQDTVILNELAVSNANDDDDDGFEDFDQNLNFNIFDELKKRLLCRETDDSDEENVDDDADEETDPLNSSSVSEYRELLADPSHFRCDFCDSDLEMMPFDQGQHGDFDDPDYLRFQGPGDLNLGTSLFCPDCGSSRLGTYSPRAFTQRHRWS